jgi:hypothetical protein
MDKRIGNDVDFDVSNNRVTARSCVPPKVWEIKNTRKTTDRLDGAPCLLTEILTSYILTERPQMRLVELDDLAVQRGAGRACSSASVLCRVNRRRARK